VGLSAARAKGGHAIRGSHVAAGEENRADQIGGAQSLGDSVITGPTLTNVNDFRAIVIDGSPTGEN